MIDKRIFTAWLSFDGKIPPLIQRCIQSQKINGYEHVIITLENCFRGSRYVNEALAKAEYLFKNGDLNHTKWLVKASDWLRCWHVCENSGIYLDADMEVLPGKNFDDMLSHRFFTSDEPYGMSANAGFGSEKDHPFLKEYMRRVEDNFKGDGDMVFDPGIRAWADLEWISGGKDWGMVSYDTDVFFPYKHHGGDVDKDIKELDIKITPNTRVFHHFYGSWYKDGSKAGTSYENKDFSSIIK